MTTVSQTGPCVEPNPQLEGRILARGKEFFSSVAGEAPSVFNKGFWTGKVMDWAMKHEDFKVQLFRFVDVLPYLNTSESLQRHIEEYFASGDAEVPAVLKWGAEKSGFLGGIAAKFMGSVIRTNIESMAKQFIIGQNVREALKTLGKLRKDGFAFVVDFLGEATVSEVEAEEYLRGYLELLDALASEQRSWPALAVQGKPAGDLDWGSEPKVNVAVKLSAFYSQAKPGDIAGSVDGLLARIVPIYRKVKGLGGFLCIDMEQLKYKEMTLEVFRRLRTMEEFRDYPHLGIVLQAYLRDTDKDLEELLGWARGQGLPISIRLVKGAYWDSETVLAKQNGWPVPVWTNKAESDAAFERQSRLILKNHDICHFACASHNVRSISYVLETAKELNVPETRYEFQVLYGMAEPVRKGLKNVAGRVRLYCPYGELLPGMAYLVRRLLENTANESFLRQSFVEANEVERLLENPRLTLERAVAKTPAEPKAQPLGPGGLPQFKNESMLDLTIPQARAQFPKVVAAFRATKGKTYPVVIGGKEIRTADTLAAVNPADPSEVLGHVCQAGVAEVDQAVAAADKAFQQWRNVAPKDRAQVLLKAAAIMRSRMYELCAVQILEVGKQWEQAFHDVGEAIDFLEYYAREAIRLGTPRRMGQAPGELNELFYEPKGLAAVIAPWNFPLAIACGMVSAAIVTGNCVLFKPSGQASIVGWDLVGIFKEAGLPDGVFNYVPGRGSVIGDYLVDHPKVAVIAFTGSVEIGLRIQERAATLNAGQSHCKRVIAEMGGKNAIIIDDDADLDEAVHAVLYSAFGFQGQKCSACSRVIVVEPIYERFIDRLRQAALSVKIGPAEDPSNFMGPVVGARQQADIMGYVELAAREGKVLVRREVPAAGCYVPLTIVEGIKPEHRIAQEEIFGPVLAVMRVKDFDQAIAWANSTRFALTGGVFSRSPRHLEKARREFRVGNLYLNRNCVGALVERQPFGGFKLSGVGSKAGGPDYLLQFLDPRVVSENTMRRGFTPIGQDDDWV